MILCNSMIRLQIVTLSLSFASMWSVSLATKASCGLATDLMDSSNEVLLKSTEKMWNKFQKTCIESGSCLVTQEPIAATTHLNYIPLKENANYKAMRQACKELGTEEAPSTLCHVNSELHVSNGEIGPKLVTDKFFARREPACFPYQCSTNQGDIAHPNPLGCDPASATCDIVTMDVECNSAEGAGTGNCKKYAAEFAADKTLSDAIDSLNADVGKECVDYKSDGDNEVCSSTTDPIDLTVAMNMRAFETEQVYVNFKDACYDTGAEVCYMSMTAKIEGEIVFFNIDLSADYNDYPMCFPTDCEVADRMEVQKEVIGKDINKKVSRLMKSGRRLSEDIGRKIDESADTRSLQLNDEYCPIKGMDKCTILIADFYCTKRQGTKDINIRKQESSASSITPGSFLAAMAMAGGMLL